MNACQPFSSLLAVMALLLAHGFQAHAAEPLVLHARSRVPAAEGSGAFVIQERELRWDPAQTAIVVCDMWDQHWCRGAAARVAEMAPRMNEVLKAARARGVLIIHCPSGCLDTYAGTPQRKRAQTAPVVETQVPLERWRPLDPTREPPLPIDDSDGGCDCDTPCQHGSPWTRQIESLEIAEEDAITDSAEAYYLMRARGITNVIVMGVHANMCVLGRPFSIRQMVMQGQNVVLMRDLTDTMYNSRRPPYVSHFRGNELVLEHIEKYWCPTITSTDFTGLAPFAFAGDNRPHVVVMIGEDEYHTWETLPEFAAQELSTRGLRVTVIHANPSDKNDFPGLASLDTADLLVLSVRRRTPRVEQLEMVRRYLRRGGPLVAIRTASHAFALRDGQPPEGCAAWPEFDQEVLGGNYHGHHAAPEGGGPRTYAWVVPSAAKHPITAGLPAGEFDVCSSLYRTSPLAADTTLLAMGRCTGQMPDEPVAWTRLYHGGRVFYTSLGHPGDFELEPFRRMLLNAVFWALGQEVPAKEARHPMAAKQSAAADENAGSKN